MSIKSHLFDRAQAFVERWHHRQTQRRESLAEHHYFVTRNALLIAMALRHYDIATVDFYDVMGMALMHDDVEKITGDVSGDIKRRYPALKALLSEIEDEIINDSLFTDLPDEMQVQFCRWANRVTDHKKHDIEAQIVKYADDLEAYLFAKTEVEVGNSLMAPLAEGLLADFPRHQWPWLKALRREVDVP